MNYIGIDIAKNAHVAAAVADRGEVLLEPFAFANDAEGFARVEKALIGAGCDPAEDVIAMESTGHYWLALWSHLDGNGWRLALVNPIQTDAFRSAQTVRKTKTDDVDSVLVAQFARFKGLGPSAVSPEAADGLKQLTRYRAHLVDERTSLKNRATALADRLFPELATVLPGGMQSMAFRAVIRDYGEPKVVSATDVRTLERTLREASRGHLGRAEARAVKDAAKTSVGVPYASGAFAFEARHVVELIEKLDEEISGIEAECARIMRETGADVIQTIPGIGPVNAAVIAAELGDPGRFEDAKKVIAFAGIDASKVQSGAFEGTESRMSKRGSSHLRYALLMAADAARRLDPYYGDYYDSMRARGKHHYVALSGVARKLAGTVLAVWKAGRPYESRPSVQSQGE